MITIRPFEPRDAGGLVRIFGDAVTHLAAADYGDDQRRAWLANRPDEAETLARCGDGRLTLVAVNDDDLAVAFIDLEDDGHIDLFYASPDVARQGVARGLYAELEEIARERGMDRLYVEASETARRFFEREGFAVTARRDFEINGVAIHNYAMEKRLDPR